jgi:outer membrane protein assembly factor BamB
MMKLTKCLGIVSLQAGAVLILALACQLVSLSPQINTSACAQEEVTLLEPSWQMAWSVKIEDGYIELPLFATEDYLIVVDRAIANQHQKRIRAYHPYSGKEAWSSPAPIGSPGQTFFVTEKYIATYAQNSTAVLYTESGEKALQFGNSGVPSLAGVFALALDDENERLYVHDFFGNLSAYQLPAGKLVWERKIPEAMRASNLFVTQRQLVVSLLTGLWIFNAENGHTLAQFPIDKSADTRLYENEILIGEELNLLRAVSIRNGKIVWEKKYRPFILYEPPAYSSGILYFPGGDWGSEGAHQIWAVSLQTGEPVWTYQAKEGVGAISGVAVMDGTGYAVFSDGTLRAFDLETGHMNVILKSEALYYWAVDDAEVFSIPSVAATDDHLFVSFGCSTLYALQTP